MNQLTVTAIVPAHNEEDGLGDTLESLLNQSVPFDRVLVAADNCTDRTVEVAEKYGVDVVECSGGSKAKAQNYALQFVDTDLVLPVDADTLLSHDYVELIKKPFDDPEVAIAAGCVLSRFSRTPTERGRTIEYLYGFHWQRPIQNKAGAPIVCSGCNSAFRTQELKDFGGFPERTIVEDMDYTWSKQIEGRKARYVGKAVAEAADPETILYFRKQTKRWMAGFFQNVRIHARELWHKPMLALWVFLAVWEIITIPVWYLTPFILAALGLEWKTAVAIFFVGEGLFLFPPLLYGALRRKIKFRMILVCLPFVYVNKAITFVYAWREMVVELVLVPLGLSTGLHDYEKGRADTLEDSPV